MTFGRRRTSSSHQRTWRDGRPVVRVVRAPARFPYLPLTPPLRRTSALHQLTLDSAIAQFRTLLANPSSSHWKALPASQSSLPLNGKGKDKEVAVHRRKGSKGGPDVVRASTEFTLDGLGLDEWRAVLQTPEVRSACEAPFKLGRYKVGGGMLTMGAGDKLVEHAHDVERIDSSTRITKTDYRLGWPAS